MSFFSWLRNGNRSAPAPRRRLQTSFRQRPSFSPRLEALEDRSLPSTLTVTTFQDSGPGSLRAEISAANAGDTIVFASPLVSSKQGHGKTTSTTITLIGGELDITKNLTIQGPAPGQAPITVSVPYGNSRVFEVGPNAVVTLSGLVISNGHAINNPNANPSWDGRGGGIKNEGTLTVSNCTLEDNVADMHGGGIYNAGALTVSGCDLYHNGANDGDGGGIYNDGTLTVGNSTLEDNMASVQYEIDPSARGGAIANYGSATVSGCQFSANSADYGGAIFNFGSLTVSGSTFSNNVPDNIYGSYTDDGGNSFS
jgi:hypothetical protein